MANPTPAAVAALKAQVPTLPGGWSGSDIAIAAALNGTLVANPTPQPTVPKPFDASAVMIAVSPATLKALLGLPSFEATIRPLLEHPEPKDAATITALNRWAAGLSRAGMLSQAEFDALAAPAPGTTAGAPVGIFNQTQPDPGWTAQVGWGVAMLGRPVDPADVAASR